MAKTNQNVTFYAGNKQVFMWTLLDDDAFGTDVPLPLGGREVRWAMSRFNDDGTYSTEPTLVKSSLNGTDEVEVTDAANGLVRVYVDGIDTVDLDGKFYQELEVVDDNGAGEPVVVATGVITIRKNVSNTLP